MRLTPAGQPVADDRLLLSRGDIDRCHVPMSGTLAVIHDAAAVGDPLLTGRTMGVFDMNLVGQHSLLAGGAVANANVA